MTATDRPLRTSVRRGAEGCLARRQPFVASSLSGRYCDVFDPGSLGKLAPDLRELYRKALADAPRLWVCYSYATPLGWRACDAQGAAVGPWCIPDARYSVTSSRHLSVLRAAARVSS